MTNEQIEALIAAGNSLDHIGRLKMSPLPSPSSEAPQGPVVPGNIPTGVHVESRKCWLCKRPWGWETFGWLCEDCFMALGKL